MTGPTRSAVREARREAAPAIAGIMAVQIAIAIVSDRRHWDLWVLPWWTWLALAAPVAVLFAALLGTEPDEHTRHRALALAMLALVVVANAAALAALIGSLLTEVPTGAELLVKAVGLWLANVVTFGLWLWELDCGGPLERSRRERRVVDLQFPQDDNPSLAPAGWRPHLLDYVYVSLTNSVAFSPTDAMPLSRKLKLVMAAETIVSLASTLLVAARAVNILQ